MICTEMQRISHERQEACLGEKKYSFAKAIKPNDFTCKLNVTEIRNHTIVSYRMKYDSNLCI